MVLYRLSLKYDVDHHALLTMVAFMYSFGAKDNSDEVGIHVSTGRNRKFKILCTSGQTFPNSDKDITSFTASD